MAKIVPDPAPGIMVSHRWLALRTGMRESFFRETLPKGGWIPRPIKSQYPIEAALEGLFRYLREQESKKTKPALDASKQKKLDLEIANLEREAAEKEGRLLTVEELKQWGAEFFPPLIQMLKVLFEVEIPANLAGLPEAAIRAWSKKKLAQAMRTWRDAESKFEPAKVVAKRPKK